MSDSQVTKVAKSEQQPDEPKYPEFYMPAMPPLGLIMALEKGAAKLWLKLSRWLKNGIVNARSGWNRGRGAFQSSGDR